MTTLRARRPRMTDLIRVGVEVSIAISIALSLAAAAAILTRPTGANSNAPDWASIWVMRWTAVGSLATAISMFAIIVTVLYAARAIAATTSIEKAKRTVDLMVAYHERKIVETSVRALGTPPGSYSRDRLQADFNIIAGFLEQCAVLFFARLLDEDIFLQRLDFAVNNAWLVLRYRIVPELEILGVWTDISQSDRLQKVCFAHLTSRVSDERRTKIFVELDRAKKKESEVRAAADLIAAQPVSVPTLQTHSVTETVRGFITSLQSGVVSRSTMTDAMNIALSPECIAGIAAQLAPLGILQRLTLRNKQGFDCFRYDGTFTSGYTVPLMIWLDSRGKIAGIS